MEKAALLAACCLVGLEDVLLSSNSQETPLDDHKRHQAVLHPAQDHKNPLWEKISLVSLNDLSAYLVQHNQLYHMKFMLNSFNLNGHTLMFHPQT